MLRTMSFRVNTVSLLLLNTLTTTQSLHIKSINVPKYAKVSEEWGAIIFFMSFVQGGWSSPSWVRLRGGQGSAVQRQVVQGQHGVLQVSTENSLTATVWPCWCAPGMCPRTGPVPRVSRWRGWGWTWRAQDTTQWWSAASPGTQPAPSCARSGIKTCDV